MHGNIRVNTFFKTVCAGATLAKFHDDNTTALQRLSSLVKCTFHHLKINHAP